ncbi:MAG: pseudouridine-5'-phosphate glycosidase [Magnetospiraceae bacterium]
MELSIAYDPRVRQALDCGAPVVALETAVLTHGLAFPTNLETVWAMIAAVDSAGAVPAVVGVLDGTIRVGLDGPDLERLATHKDARKISSRDLGAACARGASGGTTVAGTLAVAHHAGIRVFATGGIGGVHPGHTETLDISADLMELARRPVLTVCAGAKGILDLPATLELLETYGIPVVGYGTGQFPAFTVIDSGLAVEWRVDRPEEAAALTKAHWRLSDTGIVLCQPTAADQAMDRLEFDTARSQALSEAQEGGITGKAVTPYLLRRIAELTAEDSVIANQALLIANAILGAEIAMSLGAETVSQ